MTDPTDTYAIIFPMTETEARQLVTEINGGLNDVAKRLRQLYDGQGWVSLGYKSWRECISTEFNFPSSRAYRLLNLAEVQENLSPIGETVTINEAQARPLTSLSADEQRAVYQKAVDTAPNGKVTAAHIERVVGNYKRAHVGYASDIDDVLEYQPSFDEYPTRPVDEETGEYLDTLRSENDLKALHSSESVEWYTPARYLEAARQVLGKIDLDPASCDEANMQVKAGQIFTKDDSGLRHEWFGCVWLNPPYGRDEENRSNQAAWSARLIAEYQSGNITAAVLLVSANTSEKWFQPLWNFPICFTDHRIDFIPAGQRNSGANHGSVLVYFGDDIGRFAEAMREFGHVIIPDGVYSRSLP